MDKNVFIQDSEKCEDNIVVDNTNVYDLPEPGTIVIKSKDKNGNTIINVYQDDSYNDKPISMEFVKKYSSGNKFYVRGSNLNNFDKSFFDIDQKND